MTIIIEIDIEEIPDKNLGHIAYVEDKSDLLLIVVASILKIPSNALTIEVADDNYEDNEE